MPDDATMIAITVNGESQTIPLGQSVADLLRDLGRDPRVLAVERNQSLVPRKTHDEAVLVAGDQIEIVTLVGGG